MAVSLEQFLRQLSASGLIPDADLSPLLDRLRADGDADAERLARELVRQKKLTAYQAQQIYCGKGQSLVLGNYVILDKLGQGGMGMVLKAEHRRMKRLVALKVLSPNVTKSKETTARFQREVQAAAKLEHPNIVAAYDADEAQGTHFFVMQYVEGKDLSSVVKTKGPLPVEQAIHCLVQAAKGLEFAHQQGVVHRDIKPANLLLDGKGVVKILDMGLARIEGDTGAQAELTSTGAVMGTIDYMAPEQARNTKTADARSDIYSLGITLWYLLIGKAAYDGTTLTERLLAHQSDPIPSLCAARKDVPPALDAVFQKMVAKQPADRYQSMTEVLAALEGVQRGTTTSAAVPTPKLTATPSDDTQFNQFLAGLANTDINPRGGKPQKTAVATATAAGVTDEMQPTLTAASSEAVTDLDGRRPARTAVHSRTATPARPAWWQDRRVQIGGGAAGLLLMGVIVIAIANRGGTQSPILLPDGVDADLDAAPGSKVPIAQPEGSSTVAATTSTRGQGSSVAAPPPAVAPFDAAQARKHQEAWAAYLKIPVEYTNRLGMKFMLIPPGEFTMGSTVEEQMKFLGEAQAASDKDAFEFKWTADHLSSEGPQHRVRITRPFYLGAHEVTQAQWQAVMGHNPSHFGGNPTHPVESVTWDDIQPFLMKLNATESMGQMIFALPTQAQWEYACRAGTTTYWSHGERAADLNLYAWFNLNAEGKTHPVGVLRPNPFGLYDMHGNVWECCADFFAADYYVRSSSDDPGGDTNGPRRVACGGAWQEVAAFCRSAMRTSFLPNLIFNDGGFRLAALIDMKTLDPVRTRATSQSKPPPALAPFDAAQAKKHQEAWAKHLGTTVETTNTIGQKLILIPPGEFMMGSTDAQIEAALNSGSDVTDAAITRIQKPERPQHPVVITKPFRMSATEVTNAQFRQFVDATKYVTEAEQYGFGSAPGKVADPTMPPSQLQHRWRTPGYVALDEAAVTQLTWNDATAFCRWLSDHESKTYRLPTEAEWEYACRAGTTTQFSFGDDLAELPKYAWYYGKNKSNRRGAQPVGTLQPNPFGLFDMHGNVAEWCRDFYDEQWYLLPARPDPAGPSAGLNAVNRGGAWYQPALNTRSADRGNHPPTYRSSFIGFRCVLELDAAKAPR